MAMQVTERKGSIILIDSDTRPGILPDTGDDVIGMSKGEPIPVGTSILCGDGSLFRRFPEGWREL